jgi:hypothetical protein
MSHRSALFVVAILVGVAALFLVGAFSATVSLTDQNCGGNGYLCEPPTANHTPSQRVGAR